MTFHSYYTTDARDGFISAVLRPFPDWTIVPRNNPSQIYPSDFSVVQLRGGDSPKALDALRLHPLVKRVTPQRKLSRMLTFAGDGKPPLLCIPPLSSSSLP